jgi:Tfp pilus assembly protein PilX
MLPLPGVRNDRPPAQLDLEIELIMNGRIHRVATRPPMPRRQRGTMLIIALIVLVAMTLAGIATMRSVDTATVMAGNIAFRQSALHAADQGLKNGYDMLAGTWTNFGADLNKEGLGAAAVPGYASSASMTEPNWSDPNAWNRAVQLPPDAAGNVVWVLVERMCTVPNCRPGDTCGQNNLCGSTPGGASDSSGREGEDNFRPTDAFSAPSIHYRITTRAVGPRNSIAIVQTMTR